MPFIASFYDDDNYVIQEGERGSIELRLVGQVGSISYRYWFSDGEAGGADYSGGSASGALSISSTSTYTEVVPIAFSALSDMTTEGDETFSINVELSGAAFLDGATQKTIEITVIDSGDIFGNSLPNSLVGTSYGESIFGKAGADAILGRSGSDQLYGGGGADDLVGGKGSDLLHGGSGNDVLKGGSGSDTLKGGSGSDSLFGGSGEDILIGGRGIDHLSGGKNADTFIFSGRFGSDTITDFVPRGKDKIDISAFSQVDSFRDLKENHMEQVEDDVVISLGRKGSITINGVDLSELRARDFVISQGSDPILSPEEIDVFSGGSLSTPDFLEFFM
jgi:Ca2+-binding RTX toxin-like protein